MIPPPLAPVLFGLILSGVMSFFVSGISTARSADAMADLPALWATNWLVSWVVAVPLVLIFAPRVRQFIERHTRKPPPAA